MKEIKENLLLILIVLIFALFFFVIIKDNQIIKEQNAQFLGDKEFYANELNEIKSTIKYQNLMIANTINQNIEDRFNKLFEQGFDCNLID